MPDGTAMDTTRVPYVSIVRVGKIYASPRGAVPALVDVSLDIAPGEFISVVGPSGCGKSTLLKLVAGLEEATSGTLQVAGADLGGDISRPVDDQANLVWQIVVRATRS